MLARLKTARAGRGETARLRQELAELRGALEESERRYRELSHRVKNEFHQAGALVRLQARESADPDRCNHCASRIGAFSELHRLLEESGAEQISMRDYFAGLERSLGLGLDAHCRFTARAEPAIALASRPASHVGMIVTEAAINAAKHAFEGRDDGVCHAELSRTNGTLRLVITDNGRGRGPVARPGRGSLLLEGMVAQLRGTLAYPEVAQGTRIEVTLPG